MVISGHGDRPDRGELTEFWHDVLSGENPGLQSARRFARMPSPPRCKLCSAPFAGPFRPVLHLLGFNRWALNEQLCRNCMQTMEQHGGGAEIGVSVLYADIRGSTALAD